MGADGGAPPQVSRGLQLRLAAFWFGIYFLFGSLLSVVLPFLLVPEHPGPGNPRLVPEDAKNTALTILETLGLLVALVVQPAAGAISDRLWGRFGRRRPLMVIGVAVAAVALLIMGAAQAFWLLILAYCLMQVAMNTAQGAYQGLLPDTIPSSDRSHASGLLGVAILSGQVTGTVVAGIFSPRAAMVPITAMVVITAAITILGVHERPIPRPARRVTGTGPATSAGRRSPDQPRGLRPYFAELRAYPDFCIVVFSRFLIFTGLACILRFAANYLRDGFHEYRLFGLVTLNSAQAATSALFALVIFLGLLATYPAVQLSKRIGRRPVLVAAALMGAVGTFAFTFANSLTVILIDGIPIGIGFGMLVSVDWAYMADLAPRNRAGKFLGFSNIASVASQSVVPFAFGPIIDKVDAGGGVTGYRIMFVSATVFYIAGAAVLQRVRLERHPDADAPIAVEPLLSPA